MVSFPHCEQFVRVSVLVYECPRDGPCDVAPWKLLQSKRRVGLNREGACLCRWSFLWLFPTLVLNELVSQIFLLVYAVTPKGAVSGKELALAFSARGHRRNFVHVHEDFEAALRHDEK